MTIIYIYIMSYSMLGNPFIGGSGLETIEEVLNNGNVMGANQHIDGSVNALTKVSAGQLSTVTLSSFAQPANIIDVSANLNQAPTTKYNFQGEIDIERQNVKYLDSDATSLNIVAPNTRIQNLSNIPTSHVLGYDTVTGKVSYKPNSSGGGEDLQQTMAISNQTGGQSINWDVGEIALQKVGVDVLKTDAFNIPAPFPPAPPLDCVKFDRPVVQDVSGSQEGSYALNNPNGFFAMNLQPSGDGILTSTQQLQLLSTNATTNNNLLQLDQTLSLSTLSTTNSATGVSYTQDPGNEKVITTINAVNTASEELSSTERKTIFNGSIVEKLNINSNKAKLDVGGYGNSAELQLNNKTNSKNGALSFDVVNADELLLYSDDKFKLQSLGDVTVDNGGDLYINNLSNSVQANVLSYDSLTKQVFYQPASSAGGETLAQTLTLGNDTAGQVIKAVTGELLLRKVNDNILATNLADVEIGNNTNVNYVHLKNAVGVKIDTLPNVVKANVLGYDTLTKEITYQASGGGGGEVYVMQDDEKPQNKTDTYLYLNKDNLLFSNSNPGGLTAYFPVEKGVPVYTGANYPVTDEATFDSALSACSNGDIIQINNPVTFTNTKTINKEIKITASSISNIITYSTATSIFNITANNVLINFCQFVNANTGSSATILAFNNTLADNNFVNDCLFNTNEFAITTNNKSIQITQNVFQFTGAQDSQRYIMFTGCTGVSFVNRNQFIGNALTSPSTQCINFNNGVAANFLNGSLVVVDNNGGINPVQRLFMCDIALTASNFKFYFANNNITTNSGYVLFYPSPNLEGVEHIFLINNTQVNASGSAGSKGILGFDNGTPPGTINKTCIVYSHGNTVDTLDPAYTDMTAPLASQPRLIAYATANYGVVGTYDVNVPLLQDLNGAASVPPLSSVLAAGNDTTGLSINANSGELLLRKANNNMLATNGSNIEIGHGAILDLVIQNATGVKINTLPNATASNIVYYDNTSKNLSYASFSNPSPIPYTGVLSIGGISVNWSANVTAKTVVFLITSYSNVIPGGVTSYTSVNDINIPVRPSSRVYFPLLIGEASGPRYVLVQFETTGVMTITNLPVTVNFPGDFYPINGNVFTWSTP
jgi:hypothetical protein